MNSGQLPSNIKWLLPIGMLSVWCVFHCRGMASTYVFPMSRILRFHDFYSLKQSRASKSMPIIPI